MSQGIVFDWLKKQKELGNDSFLSYKEIYEGMKQDGYDLNMGSVARQVNRLWQWDFIDMKLVSYWQRTFRIKCKYTRRKKRK